MKRLTALWSAALFLPCAAALAELPYTFEAGDPIRASELNANFQYLESLGSGGEFAVLVRRQSSLSTASFRDVVTVPSESTNGWVLRSYVTNCGTVTVRIDGNLEVPLAKDEPLLVRPGETLSARCNSSPSTGASALGYFMFNEQ